MSTKPTRPRTRRGRFIAPAARRGFSLVEMVAATALVAGTLAPALAVMRDAMRVSREGGRRNLLANYAVQTLETYTALSMQAWTTGTAAGNELADGHPTIRFQVTCSDSPVNGGITDRLMHLQVVVFDDADNDAVFDANELNVRVRTKIAKLATYENEPN